MAKFSSITAAFAACVFSVGALHAESARVVTLRGDVQSQQGQAAVPLVVNGLVSEGAALKTGSGSSVSLAVLPECRVNLLSGADLLLGPIAKSKRGPRIDPMPRSTAAMKSVLTHSETEVAVYEEKPASASMTLRSGAMVTNVGNAKLTVFFDGGRLLASDCAFAATAVPTGGVRVTVGSGSVLLRFDDGRRVEINAKQFARAWPITSGFELAGPLGSDNDIEARLDLATIEQTTASTPEAIASGEANPAATAQNSGTQSATFDLADPKQRRLLSPPNQANVSGAVQSPEQP